CCVSVGMILLDGGECLLPMLSRELFPLLPGETCGTSTWNGCRFPAVVLSNGIELFRQAACLVDPGIWGTCLEVLPQGRNGDTACIGDQCGAAWVVSTNFLAISDRSPRIVLGGVYIETREYRISIYWCSYEQGRYGTYGEELPRPLRSRPARRQPETWL